MHRAHLRMADQRVDRFLVAVDDIQYAVRKARLFEQLREQQRSRRVAFGGLEHKTIAAGNRHRKHPQRHHGRKIEGRHARHHAQRLAQRIAIDFLANVFGILAFEHLRYAGGELHDFHTPGQLAASVGNDLAVFARNERRDPIAVPEQQFSKLEQHARTLQGRRR